MSISASYDIDLDEVTKTATPAEIWYLSDLSLCNYDCDYCASGVPGRGGRTNDRVWLTEASESRFKRVIDWLDGQGRPINLRLQTLGEPFVSDDVPRAATRLSRCEHIQSVELVTNGSLVERRWSWLADADVAKLAFWITFHHTETTVEQIVEAASFAAAKGASVVVNALLFPDNLESVERLVEAAADRGLLVNVDPGYSFNGAYGGRDFIPAMHLEEQERVGALLADEASLATNLIALARPTGLPCSAGRSYFFIDPAGDVFPCKNYATHRSAKSRIGSVLDEAFELPDVADDVPCLAAGGCGCKEDFSHLALFEREEEGAFGRRWGRAPQVRREASDALLAAASERVRDPRLRALLSGLDG